MKTIPLVSLTSFLIIANLFNQQFNFFFKIFILISIAKIQAHELLTKIISLQPLSSLIEPIRLVYICHVTAHSQPECFNLTPA